LVVLRAGMRLRGSWGLWRGMTGVGWDDVPFHPNQAGIHRLQEALDLGQPANLGIMDG
jgi:hypothetical protein